LGHVFISWISRAADGARDFRRSMDRSPSAGDQRILAMALGITITSGRSASCRTRGLRYRHPFRPRWHWSGGGSR
jgi:hypothetical protein